MPEGRPLHPQQLTEDQPIYRFADYNAGQYASRNAAFQQAASIASGQPLDLDGDLALPGDTPSRTEAAVRSIAARLGVDDAEIHRALEQEQRPGLEQTRVWLRTFALAEQVRGHALPRAILPRVELHSPKITRPLTTEWFAHRVDERYHQCLARAAA